MFWRYVDIQFKLWHEVIILFKSLSRCKKIDSKSDFSQSFRFKACFFPKTSLSETGFLRKWENVNFDILAVWTDKKNFGSKMSKKAWCFETSSTWKSVALLKLPFQTWCVVNRMFQKLTRCKVSDTKKRRVV